MVCIFEEASAAESPLRLTWDAAVSLVRQWLLRESIWKYPLAVALAALIVLIGVRLPVAARPHRHAHLENASVEFFMVATLASLTAVSLTTIFCVFWFRMANRLRRPALR
jgi:hypothetical protein